MQLFVHRAGRVARAGTSGTCHSLVTTRELPYLLDTSVFLGRPIASDPQAELRVEPLVDVAGTRLSRV
jgi:superfamily II DNA/RNA helicase